MIRLAKEEDLVSINEIYETARNYMAAHKNPNQWIDGYPERELLLDDIANHNLYVCYENEEIYGVFTLIFGEDPTYKYIEGAWLDDTPYATIHRIASKGSKKVFDKCIKYALSKIKHLRADTHHDNEIMNSLLQRYGFEYTGIIYCHNGTARNAYELSK